MERTAVSAGMAFVYSRDVFPAPAFSERGTRADRLVLHARLQPGVDLSRWILLDRDAARRRETRAARRPHAYMERDGMVRRLRPPYGIQLRASRFDESGILRR